MSGPRKVPKEERDTKQAEMTIDTLWFLAGKGDSKAKAALAKLIREGKDGSS